MPQVGIDRGETPGQAAFREFKEVEAQCEDHRGKRYCFYYDLPDRLAIKV